jgi:hypothetical protein
MSIKRLRRSENGRPWTTLVCSAAQEEQEKYLMFYEVTTLASLHGSDTGVLQIVINTT